MTFTVFRLVLRIFFLFGRHFGHCFTSSTWFKFIWMTMSPPHVVQSRGTSTSRAGRTSLSFCHPRLTVSSAYLSTRSGDISLRYQQVNNDTNDNQENTRNIFRYLIYSKYQRDIIVNMMNSGFPAKFIFSMLVVQRYQRQYYNWNPLSFFQTILVWFF